MLVNYKTAIDKVEQFMHESGVRDFCSAVCHGKCCHGCYTTRNACHRNEGRRLACSIFLCRRLEMLLFNLSDNSFNSKQFYGFRFRANIEEIIRSSFISPFKDIFFDPYHKTEIAKMRFSLWELNDFLLIELGPIRKMINILKNLLPFDGSEEELKKKCKDMSLDDEQILQIVFLDKTIKEPVRRQEC